MLKKILKAYADKMQWHTDKKIVVFESDDWGSSRMPDFKTLQRLVITVPKIADDYYAKFDSLEKAEDLERLFDILEKYTDSHGNHPIITANSIMANPDFKKIRESDFMEYHYEPFYKTIKARADGENTLKLWDYGVKNKLFQPQFHGREHLLVPVWLHELQAGNKELIAGFNEGIHSVPFTSKIYSKRKNLQAAFDYSEVDKNEVFQQIAIKEGMDIFSDYFGFRSKSFIASAYIWNKAIEKTLLETGIKYIQGLPVQYEPKRGHSYYSKRLHYTGQTNKLGQFYLVRNVFFEPSHNTSFDWIDDCMERIASAFAKKSPVIMGVHRVNFIGSIVAANRDKNLLLFNQLLSAITRSWPDVEFMSSDQLGDLIYGIK